MDTACCLRGGAIELSLLAGAGGRFGVRRNRAEVFRVAWYRRIRHALFLYTITLITV